MSAGAVPLLNTCLGNGTRCVLGLGWDPVCCLGLLAIWRFQVSPLWPISAGVRLGFSFGRLGRLSGGESHPAVQQKCPLVMVPRLADTSFDTRRRRPVRGKEFAQGSRCRINEVLQAKGGNRIS